MITRNKPHISVNIVSFCLGQAAYCWIQSNIDLIEIGGIVNDSKSVWLGRCHLLSDFGQTVIPQMSQTGETPRDTRGDELNQTILNVNNAFGSANLYKSAKHERD